MINNHKSPIDITASGIVIVEIFVYENAFSPISNSDDGNVTLVSVEHLSKQLFPIDVTPSGIFIDVIFVLQNASLPILINDDGN